MLVTESPLTNKNYWPVARPDTFSITKYGCILILHPSFIMEWEAEFWEMGPMGVGPRMMNRGRGEPNRAECGF